MLVPRSAARKISIPRSQPSTEPSPAIRRQAAPVGAEHGHLFRPLSGRIAVLPRSGCTRRTRPGELHGALCPDCAPPGSCLHRRDYAPHVQFFHSLGCLPVDARQGAPGRNSCSPLDRVRPGHGRSTTPGRRGEGTALSSAPPHPARGRGPHRSGHRGPAQAADQGTRHTWGAVPSGHKVLITVLRIARHVRREHTRWTRSSTVSRAPLL